MVEARRYAGLPASLSCVLSNIGRDPSPHVPNPLGSSKRASVALIVRIRPAYGHEPAAESTKSDPGSLDSFFSQPWVQAGSPEVLFIRRVDRSGDRWSGHVALPGGRRDAEDESDEAAAVREAREEVGIDLTSSACVSVGSLPQRVTSTTWGNRVLMVICPFVFLLTSPESPALRLQPTEIAATHWVPISALLSPSLRTQQLSCFTDRMFHRQSQFVRSLVRGMIGQMTFSAIRLLPSESLFSTVFPFTTDTMLPSSKSWFGRTHSPLLRDSPPLNLWGLTLGILADFLDQFPPHDAVSLWTFPTFTPPDLRLIIWLVTYRTRRQNARSLNDGSQTPPTAQVSARRTSVGGENQTAVDAVTAAVAVDQDRGQTAAVSVEAKGYAVGKLLNGYYSRMKIAIVVFLAWRFSVGVGAAILMIRLWKQRKGAFLTR